MTSSREERDILQSYRLGVNSYIVKPLDFEQFLEAMHTQGMYWLLPNRRRACPRRRRPPAPDS
jgi:two-component system, response regulator